LPIVAIDGPAGAGKSSVARRLAEALSFILIDTGAMYRALALAALRESVDWSDARKISELAHALIETHALALERDADCGMLVRLDGEDVSELIRTPEMARGASTVSAYPEVRRAFVELQRVAGREGGVVLEGRDIGTVVFPDAEVKFFLTASVEARARRRFDELVARGTETSFGQTLEDVKRRDIQDETRAVAPLRQAEGAIVVDTTHLTFAETVASMLAHVKRVLG